MRKASQVEVSATDAIKLGMNVPVRESGDIAGSAPVAIVGPKGAVYLKEGCIVAMRHIHMSPKDAQAAGVKDGDIVSVKADNERGTIFNQVKIRVDDSFTLLLLFQMLSIEATPHSSQTFSSSLPMEYS